MSERYVARSGQFAARRIGDELMIMSFRDSSLFSLNATAALLWQAADGVTPLARIVERVILPAYDVDAATALRDAEEVAADLAGRGILTLSEAPIPDVPPMKAAP
jgi:coenzyme PQQ synthesis protein D (PqqD)